MKGEGKMMFKSKMKWVGLVGLILSVFSLLVHIFIARFTEEGVSEYQSSITIFSWRPIFENANFSKTVYDSPLYRRLWGPVRCLESLHPDASPRGYYAGIYLRSAGVMCHLTLEDGHMNSGGVVRLVITGNGAKLHVLIDPSLQTNGFLFVRIQGGFHEIRNSIPDVVVVSRLLNATLVIPEIQSTTSSKGISSQFKSFAYLYNEDQFMVALTKDVNIIKTLPKNLKGARRKKKIPVFKVPYKASPYYYLHHVLPVLNKHSVVELVVSEGGCLQAILPPHLEEYQRLRCRVAYHALRFRQEVQEVATRILHRLRASRRPFVAFDPGMTRDALAYHGCAELFQDVHTELIQHKRSWMIKRRIVRGKLSVNSVELRLNGSCPLMPEEIGILLRAYGYPRDTIIYVSGGEVFGGQRTLVPLHSMFENIVDRTSLSTGWEISRIYGREANLIDPKTPPAVEEEVKQEAWKTAGPRPRPLPPPPARPKSYNIEGWWGWVAESDNEPESTVIELRTNAHKLLWEAIDYKICVEADVFIPGFDRDGKGHPNFASLVMGHRLYQLAATKTYRPDSREIVRLLEEARDHLYQANHTWLTSLRRHLRRSMLDGLTEAYTKSKPLSFLSHPAPECSCLRYDPTETSHNASSSATHTNLQAALGVVHHCPAWMDSEIISGSKDKENEEDLDEDDSLSSGLFFRPSGENRENGGGEMSKEEAQLEDQEEEGGE